MGAQDTTPVGNGDLAAQLHRLTELVIDGQARNGARLDRIDLHMHGLKDDVAGLKSDVAVLKSDVAVLKSDVAVLKSDVAVLKTDVAVLKTEMVETKDQLNRLELSSNQRFDRIDAKLESWSKYIEFDERRRPGPRQAKTQDMG